MSLGARNLDPPTAAQQARMASCRRDGCVACHLLGLPREEHCGATEYHHFTDGGHRLGHNYGVSLGRYHHQGLARPGYSLERTRAQYGPNLLDDRTAFHARFGSDQTLLNVQQDRLGCPRVSLPGLRDLRMRGIRNKRRSSQCVAGVKTYKREPPPDHVGRKQEGT